MRYSEIILEANYRNKFDTSKIYSTRAEFDNALKTKFGITGPNKEGMAKAGGAIYIFNPKGIVGYRVPNQDSPDGYVWYMVKEPFTPATKAKTPATPVEPAVAKQSEPKAVKAEPKKTAPAVDPKEALTELYRQIKSIRARNSWGEYQSSPPEPEHYDKDTWCASIRDWGRWQIPDGEEDDGDYDWEELSDESATKLQGIINEFSKRYPTIEFRWQTGEKNWIYVYAKAK